MKNVHDELSRCIIQMLFKEPFFNHLLSGIVRTITEKIPTMAVGFSGNQVQLLVNERFFIKELRSKTNRVAVVKHEALHLLFKHVFRMDLEKYDRSLFNIAADLVVNQFIGSWDLPDNAVTLDKFPALSLEPDQTVEWYYDRLYKLRKDCQKNKSRKSLTPAPRSAKALSEILGKPTHSDHSTWGIPKNVDEY